MVRFVDLISETPDSKTPKRGAKVYSFKKLLKKVSLITSREFLTLRFVEKWYVQKTDGTAALLLLWDGLIVKLLDCL